MNSESKNNFDDDKSTVFSAPEEHNDYKQSFFKTTTAKILIGALGAVIITAFAYVVIKIIPERQPEHDINDTETILEVDINTVNSVKIESDSEKINFYKKENSTISDRKYDWFIEGVEEEKISKTETFSTVLNVVKIIGREQSPENESVCGFDSSICAVTVSGESKNYNITVGKKIGNEYYIKLTGDFTGIYAVSGVYIDKFLYKRIDYANSDSYQMPEFSGDISDYCDSGGKIIKFDTITLSGKNYEVPLTFGMNDNDLTNVKYPYSMISPEKINAENVDLLFNLFTNTLGVDGAYSLTDDEQQLKEYGLDDPDIVVTLSIKGEEKWFKFKSADNDYFAVLNDSVHMIRKVKKSMMGFYSYVLTDYMTKKPIPYDLKDISLITARSNEFDLKYKVSSDPNGNITVTENGKNVNSFENVYEKISNIISDYTDEDFSGYDLSLIITLTNGKSTEILFKKNSQANYLYSVDGVVNKITMTQYNDLYNSLKELQ